MKTVPVLSHNHWSRRFKAVAFSVAENYDHSLGPLGPWEPNDYAIRNKN